MALHDLGLDACFVLEGLLLGNRDFYSQLLASAPVTNLRTVEAGVCSVDSAFNDASAALTCEKTSTGS